MRAGGARSAVAVLTVGNGLPVPSHGSQPPSACCLCLCWLQGAVLLLQPPPVPVRGLSQLLSVTGARHIIGCGCTHGHCVSQLGWRAVFWLRISARLWWQALLGAPKELWLCWLSLGHWGPSSLCSCLAESPSCIPSVPREDVQLLHISTHGCHSPGCDVPVWCSPCWRTAPHWGLGIPGLRDVGAHSTHVWGVPGEGDSLVDILWCMVVLWVSCPELLAVESLQPALPRSAAGCSSPVSLGADNPAQLLSALLGWSKSGLAPCVTAAP